MSNFMDIKSLVCYIYYGDNMENNNFIDDMKKKTINIKKSKKITKNTKSFGPFEVVFLIILTCIISLIMGLVINLNSGESKANAVSDETLSEFIETYNKIVGDYYEDIDKEKLLNGAIDGMLNTLDEYSSLLDEESNENFYLNLNGSYQGIGVQVVNDENNNIVIIGVLEDSPAKKAGVKVGDIAKSIDEVNLIGKDIKELSGYVKENNKEIYVLVIERDGKNLTFELKKENVTIKSVDSRVIEKDNKKIGYIYISIFSNTTAAQYADQLKELEKQNIDSLILDVRENSGGHLTTVVSMLSLMLSSDNVIYQVEKDNKITKFYSIGTKTKTYPVVILQNGNSASASELFAAALKDQLNAKIIGETSYGKGTIQEVNYLSNGSSYKYTTKKWFTPKGVWIHEKGITPDIEIKLNETYENNAIGENDNQLNAAIEELLK